MYLELHMWDECIAAAEAKVVTSLRTSTQSPGPSPRQPLKLKKQLEIDPSADWPACSLWPPAEFIRADVGCCSERLERSLQYQPKRSLSSGGSLMETTLMFRSLPGLTGPSDPGRSKSDCRVQADGPGQVSGGLLSSGAAPGVADLQRSSTQSYRAHSPAGFCPLPGKSCFFLVPSGLCESCCQPG